MVSSSMGAWWQSNAKLHGWRLEHVAGQPVAETPESAAALSCSTLVKNQQSWLQAAKPAGTREPSAALICQSPLRLVLSTPAACLTTHSPSAISKRRSVAALACTLPFSCAAHARSSARPAAAGPQGPQWHSCSCSTCRRTRGNLQQDCCSCKAACGSDIIAAICDAGP